MTTPDATSRTGPGAHWSARLPFFYGWVIVGIAFVTMAVGVSARTGFSLMLSPLIGEFGWDRGLVAGAFSFGFMVSAVLSPLVGRAMDRYGPRVVIECGVVLLAAGLFLAPLLQQPWQLYATLGVLVGGGANMMTFTAQSLYLPNWFARRRGLAISIAFSGVGVGAIIILPYMQTIIEGQGWREACWFMGILVVVVVAPLNLLVRLRPADIGAIPDGKPLPVKADGSATASNIVDTEWAATEWTVRTAMRTGRFWWIAGGFFCSTYGWYAVQVHQTTFLIEAGFDPIMAAWALGLVSIVAIPGQIGLGALSDRVGREIVWSLGCLGFIICYAALIVLEHQQSSFILYVMVIAQGCLGYAVTSVLGPIVAEIFEGPHYGSIFGILTVALIGGGAAGPWVTGMTHDATGSSELAFYFAICLCIVGIIAIWIATPRQVRMVPGKIGRAA